MIFLLKVTERTLEDGTPTVYIEGLSCFDIGKIFDCGQCFRFDPVSVFGNKVELGGVAFGKFVVFGQDDLNSLTIYGSTYKDYLDIWYSFLSLDIDYDEINKEIEKAEPSQYMREAILCSYGIRILRQDPYEAICSFIISQNNNIPRIKGIIENMCKKYGESVYFRGREYHAFPTPEALFSAGEDGLFALKTGFRAKYIYDFVSRLVNKEIDLNKIYDMTFENALLELTKVKGIGLKVASCALLFGFGKTEAFPVDVWIKRVLEEHFPRGINLNGLGKNAGIAQQYLFYRGRYL